MDKHTTNHILMIKPVGFTYNEETAENNYYQQEPESSDESLIQKKALSEFNDFVSVLKDNGVTVTIITDTPSPATPDSIFPNNWVSFHEDGHLVIYPMFAENRRMEKRPEILDQLIDENDFRVTKKIDLSYFEENSQFLEGTGSMILDRPNKLVYAAISDRMEVNALNTFCDELGYKAIVFNALQTVDGERLPIYHTNVMMSLGASFSVICIDSIDDLHERKMVIDQLKATGKEIITITENQVTHFAGNMLEVSNNLQERLLVMSESAYLSLKADQLSLLEKHCRLLYSNLETIEKLGGGSARCMMAEVFLPKKS